GFGIGTFPTLAADVELGRLVTPFPRWQVPGSAYFVLVPLDSDKPKHLREFLAWLHAASERAAQ
ncbi:MAG: LysR substrate-binding domain-containing protein, partial [Hydrogenophaga sp.]